MEILTIILSSLITLISPVNLIGDVVLEKSIRSQVEGVEQIAVRIDNAPSYQALDGEVNRVRIATRGLQLSPDVKINTLELDIDRIDVNLRELLQEETWLNTSGTGTIRLRQLVREPLQVAVRVVLTEEDINRALQLPKINAELSRWIKPLLESILDTSAQNYKFSGTRIDLLDNQRLVIQVNLQDLDAEDVESQEVEIELDIGLKVVAGQSLYLIKPSVLINDAEASSEVVSEVEEVLVEPLALKILEELGIIVRILKLDLSNDEIELATFIRVDAFTASALIEIQEFIEYIEQLDD
ncbi:MAG: DUF2993 domain-containing protein [Xenococcaceae cyanobacterium]